MVIFEEQAMDEMIQNLTQRLLDTHQDRWQDVALVGIQTRGYPLAERIAKRIKHQVNIHPLVGKLDISLYRDDLAEKGTFVTIRETNLPFEVTSKEIIVVDDVLFSGRTARAAIDALLDYGRPKRITLAVLIDRGCRELPIRADFIGRELQGSDYIHIHLLEVDGEDAVVID